MENILQKLTGRLPGLEEKAAPAVAHAVWSLGDEAERYPAELSGGSAAGLPWPAPWRTEDGFWSWTSPFPGDGRGAESAPYPLIREAGVPVILVTHEEEVISASGGPGISFFRSAPKADRSYKNKKARGWYVTGMV